MCGATLLVPFGVVAQGEYPEGTSEFAPTPFRQTGFVNPSERFAEAMKPV